MQMKIIEEDNMGNTYTWDFNPADGTLEDFVYEVLGEFPEEARQKYTKMLLKTGFVEIDPSPFTVEVMGWGNAYYKYFWLIE